jgi:hypothetical protein
MWRKRRIVALALAVVLALAPATPRAEVGTAAPDGAGKAMRYVACAGSIVFMIAVPASVFYTTLVCINAFLASDD